jgi:hypothetical protein
MTGYEQDLHQLLHAFIADVTALARRAALQALQRTLGAPPQRSPAGGRPVGRPPGSRVAMRTTEELDALAQRFVACVQTHPGLRVEQLNRLLGTSTRHLALPIRKLLATGAIRVQGQRRATAYYAATAEAVH